MARHVHVYIIYTCSCRIYDVRMCLYVMCVLTGHRWALWYFKSDKNKDWKDNLKLVISFDTVSNVYVIFN